MRFVRSSFALPGRRLALPSLHDGLWWALAALIAALAAALLWALVTPVTPLGNWQPTTVRVMSPAARAALFASIDPFNRAQAPQAGAASGETVTALSLTLFGTRSTPGGQGSAIIAGADGLQKVYRVGTEVTPGVTLAEVGFDHVVLSRNGARELLYLDQSGTAPTAQAVVAGAPPAPPGGGAPSGPLTVDAVRTGLAFAPHAASGKVVGLEVQPSGDGAAFRAAGFQPGDVIMTIGGKPVTGAGDAQALAGSLKPGASIAVTVQRGDQTLPLALTLAP